jgi:hypothetical protein
MASTWNNQDHGTYFILSLFLSPFEAFCVSISLFILVIFVPLYLPIYLSFIPISCVFSSSIPLVIEMSDPVQLR